MTKHFDVIVVGVGSMGASACYQLARRGVKVLGLEQFDIPNVLGATSGFSRMIRLAYFEHPDYVTLLHRAYELWHEIEQESGQKLFHKTGGLYAGRPDCDLISGSVRAAGEYDLPHEQLDRAQVLRQFPQIQLPDDYVGFFEPEAGLILSEATVATYATQALRNGAQLHGRESVLEWKAYADGVAVKTDSNTYNADRLILCTGAWTSNLLHGLQIELRVTRQVMGWLWPKRPELFELGKFPVWAIDPGHQGEFKGVYYGFPMMPQSPGLKFARHFPADTTDPDQVDRTPTQRDIDDFMPAVHQYFPDALGPLLAARVCMYTNSADGHFIIDKHPEHPQVILACGFSGHGFKFVSVIGQVLADLAQHGQSELPVEFLSLDRLTKA